MNIDETAMRDMIHVRLCCKDWQAVRGTVRLPFDSDAEELHETLGCIVNFPALTASQWEFLKPELDRLGLRYDHIDHRQQDARWVLQLTDCH